MQLRLPDGTAVPLVAQVEPAAVPPAIRAFDRDTANLGGSPRMDRYVGVIRGRAIGPDPGPVLQARRPPALVAGRAVAIGCAGAGCAAAGRSMIPPDTTGPVVEAVWGVDTVRVPWPLQVAMLDTLPAVAELDDDPLALRNTDRLTVGRAIPGGTYYWFFPTGTRAVVSGRINGALRLRLSGGAEAWVPAGDARPLPGGVPQPRAVVGAVTVTPVPDRAVVRVPVGERLPFQVQETERTLVLRVYGARGDVDWIRYGATDSLIKRVSWAQPAPDEVTLTLELAAPVWGYRTRWSGGDLILEVRRPPPANRGAPLRGRVIAVDPGHPPAGATGPTGLREAEANLAVALRLRDKLDKAGARVVMTRVTDTPVDLWSRVRFAEASGAELLVSIHNNALPDGVNPFTNNGTSVFFNHLRGVPLAAEIQRALLKRLGLRDLGIGRGDLALVRTTWLPAVLCEGLFIILPDQEAALRSPGGQERYAEAVYEGIERFLRARARRD